MSTPRPEDRAQYWPGHANLGVLVLHGFTSTPASVLEWARAVHAATDRAGEHPSVSVPVLPGHGTSWHDLARTPWQDWRDAAEHEYWRLRREHGRVLVAGLSMGGTLALHLAERHPVAGVLTVNPALGLVSRLAPLAPVLRFAVPRVAGIGSDIRRAGVTETTYPYTPVAAVAQLRTLIRDTVRALPALTAPTFVLRSAEDHVVADSSVRRLRERSAGQTAVLALPNSYHVATLDHDRALVESASRDAVCRVLRGEPFLPTDTDTDTDTAGDPSAAGERAAS